MDGGSRRKPPRSTGGRVSVGFLNEGGRESVELLTPFPMTIPDPPDVGSPWGSEPHISISLSFSLEEGRRLPSHLASVNLPWERQKPPAVIRWTSRGLDAQPPIRGGRRLPSHRRPP
jgi:hypothetical protein